jgi:preprotein translocase subunit YajC
MYFGNLTVAAASAASTSSGAANTTGALVASFLPFVLLIVIFYFLLIRPQNKKQKKEQKMRESVQVGDNITTVGGIVGRVVSIKDDAIVVETGADRNKMLIKKWAIQSVETLHDA